MNDLCTYAQFERAIGNVCAAWSTSFEPKDSQFPSGTVRTKTVDFTYAYDGRSLEIAIIAKHGIALLKDDQYAFGRIHQMLGLV